MCRRVSLPDWMYGRLTLLLILNLMNKKKKKGRTGKTTLKRPQRLLKAKAWLTAYVDKTYTDKQIVHAYAKKFHTDFPISIIELRKLGISISTTYEEAVKKTLVDLAIQRCAEKEAKLNAHLAGIEQDEHFAYIVGYTSGGAPYGVTWDELDDEERELYTYKNLP